jgi:CTP:molybdopterin cytidylyltransferase MocA
VIEAIVLAAGRGERLGTVKPLVPVDGAPALERVVEALRHAGLEGIVVVLGHEADRIEAQVDLRACRVVRNPAYETGMGSSLAAGIDAVTPGAQGVLVLHADMPFVTGDTIRAVVEQAEAGARAAAPRFAGRRGFPVYLRSDRFAQVLEGLDGEVGARAYLAAHPEDLVLVDVDDPGAVRDIDRPEDLPSRRTA